MDLNELDNTLIQRRKGLAYQLWRSGNLSQMLDKYPNTPEEACPELYPPKKKYAMPDFLKKKYYEREADKWKKNME